MMDGKCNHTENTGPMRDPDQGTDSPACPPEPGQIWDKVPLLLGVSVSPTNSRLSGAGAQSCVIPVPGLQHRVG